MFRQMSDDRHGMWERGCISDAGRFLSFADGVRLRPQAGYADQEAQGVTGPPAEQSGCWWNNPGIGVIGSLLGEADQSRLKGDDGKYR